ncbi:hypothetical protein [Streptomyces californicus]|uniref:hypothetical protein n=1 Tax=Streptomyces californicus TaxID=67351 RepID=UPI0036C16056
MSYNQPGPYGGQPPQGQPGPYGQQPGPYGAPPPQGGPGYGYPQQAPQGVPPQQPNPYAQPQQPQGYGYPQAQQPGPYGQQQPPGPPYGGQPQYGGQPPYGGQPQQPKKKTGLIVGVAVVALAVIAGGVYFLTSGGGSSDVADSTKGYKLTPAASVDDYKQDPSKKKPSSGTMSGEKKAKAEAMGIKNPNKAEAAYMSGDLQKNPLTSKVLMLTGVWGEIEDPASTIDKFFASAQQDAVDDEKSEGTLVGSPKEFTPSGFEGALMKCQDLKVVNEDADGSVQNGPKEMTMPICVWADYSTVGAVVAVDIGGAMTNKSMSQEETAALAAKLYNTSRTKI